MHLLDSMGNHPKLKYTCSLHEQAGAIGAEAYAQYRATPSALLVTTGPGGTNAITGIAGAFIDSTPVFVLSGQVKRADLKLGTGLRQKGPQEVDIVSMVKPITKYAVTILDPLDIKYELEKAWFLAVEGRPGPVWIDVPLDVQAATIEPEKLRSYEPEKKSHLFSQEVIKKTVDHLLESKRPVILAGNGIRHSHAEAEFQELINLLNVPVLLTWKAIDFLDESHPQNCGRPGTIAQRGANIIQQKSDWMLSLGARLDSGQTAFNPGRFAPKAKRIIVDIDAEEISKLGPQIEYPVVSDVRPFLQALLVEVKSRKLNDWKNWLSWSKDIYQRFEEKPEAYAETIQDINLYDFVEELSSITKSDAVIVPGSSGACSEVICQKFRIKKGQRLLNTQGLGAMGFGLPASIGVCLASGRKNTILVNGDGGIQLNIQELETIRRLALPIKIFVLQNHGYRSIVISQNNFFKGRLVASDDSSGVTLPSMERLARAYEIPYFEIKEKGQLKEKIQSVLNTPGAVICDVRVDPNHLTLPKVRSQILADGNIVSMPMEDLFPFLPRDEFEKIMND